MDSYRVPTKIDFTPRRYHAYAVLLCIMGTLFPPLAVAARFGIGSDFWLNLLLTICGYIPGHLHNFYIQNIRNNKNHARTPKWAQRYGLVDTSEIRRKERKSQWASRYNDRLPQSTLEGQPYEEGQVASASHASLDSSESGGGDSQRQSRRRNTNDAELWGPQDESYYGAQDPPAQPSSSGRWKYPANFDDAVREGGGRSKVSGLKKKQKKDRWARTEDAYQASEEPSPRKKSKKKKIKKSSSGGVDDGFGSRDNSNDGFPEDPEGGLYRDRSLPEPPRENGQRTTDDVLFNHEL